MRTGFKVVATVKSKSKTAIREASAGFLPVRLPAAALAAAASLAFCAFSCFTMRCSLLRSKASLVDLALLKPFMALRQATSKVWGAFSNSANLLISVVTSADVAHSLPKFWAFSRNSRNVSKAPKTTLGIGYRRAISDSGLFTMEASTSFLWATSSSLELQATTIKQSSLTFNAFTRLPKTAKSFFSNSCPSKRASRMSFTISSVCNCNVSTACNCLSLALMRAVKRSS